MPPGTPPCGPTELNRCPTPEGIVRPCSHSQKKLRPLPTRARLSFGATAWLPYRTRRRGARSAPSPFGHAPTWHRITSASAAMIGSGGPRMRRPPRLPLLDHRADGVDRACAAGRDGPHEPPALTITSGGAAWRLSGKPAQPLTCRSSAAPPVRGPSATIQWAAPRPPCAPRRVPRVG
jgi:hypothetical protein